MDSKSIVVGVDGCKEGWVGVAIDKNGAFIGSFLSKLLKDIISHFSDASVIGVDMPLKLVNKPFREADQLVRKELGVKRGRSVFPAIPNFMIDPKWIDLDPEDLNIESRKRFGCAFSRQTLNLKNKILEVNQCQSENLKIIEVHPEFCFMQMNDGMPQPCSKKTWNGMQQRLFLLKTKGIYLPSDLGSNTGNISPDDIIDAAAGAWTAKRFSEGLAVPHPEDPNAPQIWV
ncbi:DUF429 domain-containing protein [Verrucomicrobiales bacterium]|nr:DUF429 domain-containing protein [Verrucomicrobiales bacterium]NCG26188.1 DUF429 domain-containing protein [Verrucomicrobiales bacterium]